MNSSGFKGRGAAFNPKNRFETVAYDPNENVDPDFDYESPSPRTEFILDDSKKIISVSDSPDLPGFHSVNPYRGCEHGCIYCYARNSHEYWGFSAGLDFETKIMVKKNAPALLEKKFNSKTWNAEVIHLSGNTDCYQPAEREFRLTRQLLEICLRYQNPVSVLTKNSLILRDLDILTKLAKLDLLNTAVSITSLDPRLRSKLEPRTATGAKRLEVIEKLSQAGIQVGVMTAPIIPGLNDHEIPEIIQEAAHRGAVWSGFTIVRLNGAIGSLFEEWVRRHFPDRANKVLHQIRECHNGSLNDSRFGLRMGGEGKFAVHIANLHDLACRRFLGTRNIRPLDHTKFIRAAQMRLF